MFGFVGETIGKIFGTDQAAKSLVENVSSGLDKLVYTSEEKAEAHAKDVSEARQMVIQWMSATSGQNLARRLLALVITAVWLLQYVSMMGLSVVAVWIKDPVNFLESARIIGGYAEKMNGAMMLILAFYFAAPHMSGIVQGAMEKFAGKK